MIRWISTWRAWWLAWWTCVGLAMSLATQAQKLEPLPVEAVAPGVWYAQGQSALGSPQNQNFISNSAFVIGPKGVVVIDALGSPALAQRLLATIAALTPLPVTHVLVTHYHADHIYGLQVFKAAGAQIIAHELARLYMNSETARLRLQASRTELAPWIDENTHLVPADIWLTGDQEIEVAGLKLQTKVVGPSHTPEDLAYYWPQGKVLFAGDLVFRSRIPFVGQADSRHWITALDELLKFDAQVIVPGHGPLSREARKDMQQTRDYLVYLRESMRRATEAMEPFDDAYKATDWSAFEHLPLFRVANRMNAYNTYLLLEHEQK